MLNSLGLTPGHGMEDSSSTKQKKKKPVAAADDGDQVEQNSKKKEKKTVEFALPKSKKERNLPPVEHTDPATLASALARKGFGAQGVMPAVRAMPQLIPSQQRQHQQPERSRVKREVQLPAAPTMTPAEQLRLTVVLMTSSIAMSLLLTPFCICRPP